MLTIKQVLIRAVKTAIQSAAGILGAVSLNWIDMELWRGAAVAALSGAASIIWNSVLTWATADAVETAKQEGVTEGAATGRALGIEEGYKAATGTRGPVTVTAAPAPVINISTEGGGDITSPGGTI